MARESERQPIVEWTLGVVGVLCIALIAWAVERQHARSRTARMVAQTLLTGVAAIGAAVDRLYLPADKARQQPYRRSCASTR